MKKAVMAIAAINVFALIWFALTPGSNSGNSPHYVPPTDADHLKTVREASPEMLARAGEAGERTERETGMAEKVERVELQAGHSNLREQGKLLQALEEEWQQLLAARLSTFGQRTEKKAELAKACYDIGPFYNKSQLRLLGKGLNEIGIETAVRDVPPNQFMGHWLYMPPEKTFSLSRLKMEEMKRKGVKDIAILTKDKPKNAISLGLFNSIDIANKRKKMIEDLGYRPELVARYKDRFRSFLMIEVDGNRPMDADRWNKILGKYKPAELISVECASRKKPQGQKKDSPKAETPDKDKVKPEKH